MKKIIKSRIFIFVLTAIIFTSIGVYAANTYKASEVLYTSSDGTSMNVQDALNDLYNKKSSGYGYCSSYKDGTAIYYNPVSGEVCNASEAVSTTGTKTGCMKWYVFNDDSASSTVNMILDHNTTATLAWYSSSTNVAYESSNIKPEVDKLVNESGWVVTPRLISAEEIAQITGNTSWTNTSSRYFFDSNSATQTAKSQGASKYAWLFDYTYNCTSYGCNIEDSSTYTNGYWTSTTVGTAGSGSNVWYVALAGSLSINDAEIPFNGIRPVITISKSILS